MCGEAEADVLCQGCCADLVGSMYCNCTCIFDQKACIDQGPYNRDMSSHQCSLPTWWGSKGQSSWARKGVPSTTLFQPCPTPQRCSAWARMQVSGRTWVDDYNLRSQHLPMISAAGMWLERRKVRLPDFEFFSRTYRPLPMGTHR